MTRVTRNDWIQFGLDTLVAEGHSQLKAGALAKRLNVSRGSFYWHFDDLAAYHSALVAAWGEASVNIATELAACATPQEKLLLLMQSAGGSDFALERAFRAWGSEHAAIGAQVDQLDHLRLQVVHSIVREAVADPLEAEHLAKFIYAAAIGLVSLGADTVGLGKAEIANVINALLGANSR